MTINSSLVTKGFNAKIMEVTYKCRCREAFDAWFNKHDELLEQGWKYISESFDLQGNRTCTYIKNC